MIVNDSLEVALWGVPVCGVHLGQEDLRNLGGKTPEQALADIRQRAREVGRADFQIGVSTHNLEDVALSRGLDVDYIGFGPVQGTQSKQNPEPVTGFDALAQACAMANVPVVAIGGLAGESATRARACGAKYVAMIGGLQAATCSEVHAKVAAEVAGFLP